MRRPTSRDEVASGVYRLGTRWANLYLVTDGDDPWTQGSIG